MLFNSTTGGGEDKQRPVKSSRSLTHSICENIKWTLAAEGVRFARNSYPRRHSDKVWAPPHLIFRLEN